MSRAWASNNHISMQSYNSDYSPTQLFSYSLFVQISAAILRSEPVPSILSTVESSFHFLYRPVVERLLMALLSNYSVVAIMRIHDAPENILHERLEGTASPAFCWHFLRTIDPSCPRHIHLRGVVSLVSFSSANARIPTACD